MMGRTHALAGVASIGFISLITDVVTKDNISLLVILAVLGSLLPDLDATASLVKSLSFGGIRLFVPISIFANRSFGHRGLLHSPGGLVLFSTMMMPLNF